MSIPASSWVKSVGCAVVAAAAIVQTLLHIWNIFVAQNAFFDVNEERNVFALLAAASIGLAGASCVIAALTCAIDWVSAVVMAAMLAFLAVDEWITIHERLGARGAALLGLSNDWDSVLWPVLYLPLLAAVLLLFMSFRRTAPAEVATLILTGLILLVLAVMLEVLSAPFSTSETADGLVHALEGAVEEAFELAGWGFLAVAMLTWSALTCTCRTRPAR